MKPKMIATWKMAYDGMIKASHAFLQDQDRAKAIETILSDVEDNPAFTSVGYGGLPNKEGKVELDSAYMDGDSLRYGAILSVHDIAHPISVAISLSSRDINCVLAQKGAKEYALTHGFEEKEMLTNKAKEIWQEKKESFSRYKAYEGHDTVCAIVQNKDASMACGVSTSGLFMKESGRVGDSPMIGSGFYCDSSLGSVCATGLGEDILRGCLSIRILDLFASGIPIQQACDIVLDKHIQRMKKTHRSCDAVSVIAMDPQGNYAASTNIEAFPYCLLNEEGKVEIWVASYQNQKHINFQADSAWLKAYTGD